MDLKTRFSPAERMKFVRGRLHAGTVVKLFCDFTTPPKFKWLLIAATEPFRPLFFVINTHPTEFARQSVRLSRQQVPISKATNSFLKHNSFIDCAVAYDNFEEEEIAETLFKDTTLILGQICPATAAAVMESITESETLSPIQINQISAEISRLF